MLPSRPTTRTGFGFSSRHPTISTTATTSTVPRAITLQLCSRAGRKPASGVALVPALDRDLFRNSASESSDPDSHLSPPLIGASMPPVGLAWMLSSGAYRDRTDDLRLAKLD